MRLTLLLLLLTFILKGQNCSFIDKKIDKFTGDITFTAPYSHTWNFYKIVRNGDTTIFINLSTFGSTANVGIKGVIILLADGTKLEYPTTSIDIDVNRTGQGYDYSATIYPSKYELDLLHLNGHRVKVKL